MRRAPSLSRVAARIRPAVFAELQARIDARVGRGEELIPLHIGDADLAPPEGARRAMATLGADDAALFRYGPTAGLPPLRAALARRLARRGIEIDPDAQIVVGNGGTHALYCAARAILDEGDEVLVAAPFWPLAPGIFAACGAVAIEVPVTQALFAGEATGDVFARLAAAIGPRTRAIYYGSPNNPDGKILRRAELEAIAALAIEHDLWVIADEVYADTVFDAEACVSIATLAGMAERTIVVQSLSKSHALAGCRVGFAVAPPAVAAAARRISTHTAFNVSVAMQRVALAALSDDAFPASARETYRDARDVSLGALAGCGVRAFTPEGATYLFLDFSAVLPPKRGDAHDALVELLALAIDRGVLLAPGDAFGAAFAHHHARLCFTSTSTDRLVAGCQRLRDAVAEISERCSPG